VPAGRYSAWLSLGPKNPPQFFQRFPEDESDQPDTLFSQTVKEGENDPRVTAGTPFLLGDARIDPSGLTIERSGSTRRVEAKVMEVLLALARQPGRVVPRRDLEQEAWADRHGRCGDKRRGEAAPRT
jgi:hypothetical protein